MRDIVQLDELTINQIAAGEVIERPSSVVKELVENSIDAGSKNITVEVVKGGIESITIIDDGHGIKKDDVEMAFERHATSKIRSAKDIESITPVRYKFLKKDYTEVGYIDEALRYLALVNKEIAFRLTNNGKVLFSTNGSRRI